jgi:hypothetical protein
MVIKGAKIRTGHKLTEKFHEISFEMYNILTIEITILQNKCI